MKDNSYLLFIISRKPSHTWNVFCKTTDLTLAQTSSYIYVSAVRVFRQHWGKGEIARDEQFLLFPTCFLPFWWTFRHCYQVKKLPSGKSLSLEKINICCLEKGYLLQHLFSWNLFLSQGDLVPLKVQVGDSLVQKRQQAPDYLAQHQVLPQDSDLVRSLPNR